jgi:spore coat protein CotH
MKYLCHLHSTFVFVVMLAMMAVMPALAQNFTDSNLPIVIINTDIDPNTGQPIVIPDEPKVLATMKIIFRPDGSRNYVSDQNNPDYLDYNGRIGIETRGSTSQMLPKKPYGLTTLQDDNVTNNNVPLLGMPEENDWILNSFAYDPSLLRDYLSYQLSNNIGVYATRTVYCEVMVNGDYKGLYILMEKIKIDSERVNLVKLTPDDNTMPMITGGYITKADKPTGGDPVAWYMTSHSGPGVWVEYIHDNPKPEDISTQQHNYIHQVFLDLQSVCTAHNASLINGYPSKIDIPSFIDFMIINELASNVDAYQFSTYFHKDRGGKLRAGPVWDHNLTYGNDLFMWGFDRSHTNVWQFNYENRGSKFWKDLFDSPDFKCYLAKTWNAYAAPGEALHYITINTLIDIIVDTITEASIREHQRWGTIGNHAEHIDSMKTWIQTRINWLNINLSNYQGCANPEVPSLVISKIHYHPEEAQGFAESDLEFIQITNNSNETIDLTGFYLRDPGISYQFPPSAFTIPGQKIFIAANAEVFEQFYGFAPFGEYFRNLSNKSHKLRLSDAWGNTIDEVIYEDDEPWPPEADGDGPYLKLISLDLDNSLPESWVASTEQVVQMIELRKEIDFNIYPNPATSSIELAGTVEIVSVEVLDLLGRTVKKISQLNATHFVLKTESLKADTYFLKTAFVDGTISVKKIVVL